MVPLYAALGISQGIMPLISYNYASKNVKRLKEGIFFTAKISIGFMICMTVGYFIGAHTLVGAFMKNEQIIYYGSRFLHGMCLSLPFLCTDFLVVGVFQSCGMGKESLVFAVLRKIVLEIPALFVLNMLFPLYGLAYAQTVAEVVLAIAAVIVLSRLLKKLEIEAEI